MGRIALIDLGSNTARLVIYDVLEGQYFVVCHEEHETVRLGETEEDGNLKQTRIMQAISTLRAFKQVCSIYEVDTIIPIATAAVRRANNKKMFLSDVFNATGLKFSIVSEEEEANYVYQGVINSMEVPRGLIMEIGGGSTKFVYYCRRTILHTKILEVGALTLTAMFESAEKTPEQISVEMKDYFLAQFQEIEWLKEVDPDTQFIGVGGSFRNLARIVKKVKKYPLDMIHNYHIETADFNHVFDMISTLDLDKKKKIKGLSAARADVFPAALSAISAVVDYMQFNSIITSGSGLREGVMFNHVVPLTLEKPISDIAGHSLHTMVHHLGINEQHAEQTFNLCVQLFKQLRVLHKFPRQYVKVLRVAAFMHDAGKKFKFYNNVKHTAYMILNSNLYGVSHRDIVLASYVTDVFNKEEVSHADWAKYSGILSQEDMDAVKKLAVILKLAVAFDASMSNAITEISCDVLGDSVIMKTEVVGDVTLEMKQASVAAIDFKKVFRKNLEIL